MSHASRSDEQQAAESQILDVLGARTGLAYSSEPVACGDEYVEIDGVGRNAAGEIVELVEVYARLGKLKGAQLKKPTDDAARLMLARAHVDGTPRLRLAWASQAAIEQISDGWRGKALGAMGVDFVHVELGDELAAGIRAAQARQRR